MISDDAAKFCPFLRSSSRGKFLCQGDPHHDCEKMMDHDTPQIQGPVALSESEVDEIDLGFYKGLGVCDADFHKLVAGYRLQKKLIAYLLSLWEEQPLRRFSVAKPLRNSTLQYIKDMASIQNP